MIHELPVYIYAISADLHDPCVVVNIKAHHVIKLLILGQPALLILYMYLACMTDFCWSRMHEKQCNALVEIL